jgi:cytochrome P450
LLRHPDVRAAVSGNASLVAAVVEETLRWDPPLQRVRRVVTKDTTVGSQRVSRGDRLSVLLASANRDESFCSSPEVFDITRQPLPHLAFGNGMHFCLGNSLGKLEARIAIAAVLERYPAAQLDPKWQPEYRPSVMARSLTSLRVVTAASAAIGGVTANA